MLGGAACMTSACITNPVEVVKTRMQMDGERGAARRYGGPLGTAWRVAADEGVRALYSGLSASLLREATYSTIRVGGYDVIKDALGPWPAAHAVPLWAKIAAGAGSGLCGAALVNPTDLVRVRMQADAGPRKRYRGLAHALISVARDEGLRGLYRGVTPTVVRAAVLTAAQLASYDESKQLALAFAGSESAPSWLRLRTDGFALHALCSAVSGCVAAFCTSPFDVVKTRVMAQASDAAGRPQRYRSMADCFVQTHRSEGLRSFWKGLTPNAGRIVPHTIIMFIVYERLRVFFGYPNL